MNEEIDKLIVKFLTNQANTKELKKLSNWLSKLENEEVFSNYVKINFVMDMNMNEFNTKETKKKLLYKIKHDKNIFYKLRLNKILKYAAVAILLFGLGYFYQQDYFSRKQNTVVIPNDESSIILKLENGNTKVISENGTIEILNSEGNVVGKQHGSQLVYNNKISPEKLTYNTLSVPYGKRFNLVLSDGTKIKLNAGTSLKYPVKFIKGKTRQVFIKGEAFFDIAKDVKHPFIVNSNELNIRVLGTKFNLSSYKEDDYIKTVLVEGSVSIYKNTSDYNDTSAALLKPGQVAAWQKNNQHLSIKKADMLLHTAWIDGKIIFRHQLFKNIIKKLERHYNVVIINHNKELDNEYFTASFDVETIDEVFKSFNKNYNIKYTIEDNKIIIN